MKLVSVVVLITILWSDFIWANGLILGSSQNTLAFSSNLPDISSVVSIMTALDNSNSLYWKSLNGGTEDEVRAARRIMAERLRSLIGLEQRIQERLEGKTIKAIFISDGCLWDSKKDRPNGINVVVIISDSEIYRENIFDSDEVKCLVIGDKLLEKNEPLYKEILLSSQVTGIFIKGEPPEVKDINGGDIVNMADSLLRAGEKEFDTTKDKRRTWKLLFQSLSYLYIFAILHKELMPELEGIFSEYLGSSIEEFYRDYFLGRLNGLPWEDCDIVKFIDDIGIFLGRGLCVTGDTLLPILRLAKEIQMSKSKIQNIPIVDVQPGDYVLSLNEETQRIEPHRINGLLDMGVKPVYRLTTASGRSIKTTANHPYLTRDGWVKVSRLGEGDEIAAPNERALLSYGDHRERIEYLPVPQSTRQIAFPFSSTSLFWMRPETNNHQNKKHGYTAKSNNKWKFLEEITCQSNSKNSLCQISYEFTYIFLSFISNFIHNAISEIPVSPGVYNNTLISIVSRLFFTPELEAAEMGGDILWDKIMSIEYLGYKHVYDIEVEGTHNFIGNGIFAHNTYLRPNGKQVDGYIGRGEGSLKEFLAGLAADAYKRSPELEEEFNDVLFELYVFNAIIYGREDYRLGYRDGNRIYIAQDLLQFLKERDAALAKEFIRHETLCDPKKPKSHRAAIGKQRTAYQPHYDPNIHKGYDERIIKDKGLLRYMLRQFIDQKYMPVLGGEAVDRTWDDETFTREDYREIFNNEVIFDRIHELRFQVKDVLCL